MRKPVRTFVTHTHTHTLTLCEHMCVCEHTHAHTHTYTLTLCEHMWHTHTHIHLLYANICDTPTYTHSHTSLHYPQSPALESVPSNLAHLHKWKLWAPAKTSVTYTQFLFPSNLTHLPKCTCTNFCHIYTIFVSIYSINESHEHLNKFLSCIKNIFLSTF